MNTTRRTLSKVLCLKYPISERTGTFLRIDFKVEGKGRGLVNYRSGW